MPSSVQRENGQNALLRPFTSDDSVGIKTTVDPVPLPDGSRRPLHGVIVLCDGTGNPTGILGGEEVTGYRTSMNAMVLFSWQKTVEKIVIFGTGMQALWHTRLILTLRGADVKSITYVNPGRKDDVNKINAIVSNENSTLWKSSCVFDGINDSHDFDISAEDRGIIEQGRLYLLHDTIENTTFRRKTPHPGTTTGP